MRAYLVGRGGRQRGGARVSIAGGAAEGAGLLPFGRRACGPLRGCAARFPAYFAVSLWGAAKSKADMSHRTICGARRMGDIARAAES